MQIGMLKKILIALLFLFFAGFLIRGAGAITQDLGRHLKLGEIIISEFNVPKINLFSYAEPDQPFVNSHWLSEIIFYLLFRVFNFPGLVIFSALMILASFALALFSAYQEKRFWPEFLISLFSIGILMERTDIRPEIFSFLFFAVYLFIFLRYSESAFAAKFLWFLPILQVFWTNLHIYFFLGPVFYLFFFAERLFKQRFVDFLKSAEFKKLLIVGVLMGLAVFINPNGIKGAFHPILVMGEYGYSIIENQTPFFLSQYHYRPAILFFFYTAWIVLIISAVLNINNIRRDKKIFNFLSVVFISLFGVYAVRNFPIFALAAIPLLADNFSGIHLNFKKSISGLEQEEDSNTDFSEKAAVIFFLLVMILGVLVNLPKLKLTAPGGAKKAVDFVIENKIEGKMFNNYDIGSYLIWRFYPGKKVFVDNRPEAYSVEFLQSVYIPMQEQKEIWEKYAEEYDFNFIIFELTDITPWAQSFLKRIINDSDWPLIYSDERAAVFVKNNEVNKPLIEKYIRR